MNDRNHKLSEDLSYNFFSLQNFFYLLLLMRNKIINFTNEIHTRSADHFFLSLNLLFIQYSFIRGALLDGILKLTLLNTITRFRLPFLRLFIIIIPSFAFLKFFKFLVVLLVLMLWALFILMSTFDSRRQLCMLMVIDKGV